jgi:hypothetical protein
MTNCVVGSGIPDIDDIHSPIGIVEERRPLQHNDVMAEINVRREDVAVGGRAVRDRQ